MIKADWVKPGACVIDVGINRIEDGERTRLVGDADFASCEASRLDHAGAGRRRPDDHRHADVEHAQGACIAAGVEPPSY